MYLQLSTIFLHTQLNNPCHLRQVNEMLTLAITTYAFLRQSHLLIQITVVISSKIQDIHCHTQFKFKDL